MERREYRKQEQPFSVTFELTEGCNLSCPMCAVSAIQKKQGVGMKYMDKKVLVSAMEQIRELGWTSRMGFAMRGEPSLHPQMNEMIAIVREHRPRVHMTMLTNGIGFLRGGDPVKAIQDILDAGLNVLGFDDYENVGIVPKIMDAIAAVAELKSGEEHPAGFTFYKYPEDLEGNPHTRRPRGTRMVVQIRDIMAQAAEQHKGTHGKIFNYAGLGAPKNDSMEGKRCHQPFRQLAIRQSGDVAICCNDWRGEYRCGNILTDGVEGIWQGPAFGAARELLIEGRRKDLEPCNGCDHRSYRVGLLPDVQGQGVLHKPDEQTFADAALAISKGPYTAPVLREWEKKAK